MMSVLDQLLALPVQRVPSVTPAGRSALFIENIVAHRGHTFEFVSRDTSLLNDILEGFTPQPLTDEQVTQIRTELAPFQNAVLGKGMIEQTKKGKSKK